MLKLGFSCLAYVMLRYMSNNQLVELPAGIFDAMPKLRFLYPPSPTCCLPTLTLPGTVFEYFSTLHCSKNLCWNRSNTHHPILSLFLSVCCCVAAHSCSVSFTRATPACPIISSHMSVIHQSVFRHLAPCCFIFPLLARTRRVVLK